MSQVTEETTRTIESASDDNLPATKEDDFLALASNKVALDLEDAPFLNDEIEKKEEAKPAEEKSESNTKPQEKKEEEVNPSSKKKKMIIIGAGVALLLLIVAGIFIVPNFTKEEPILQNVIVVPGKDVKTPPVSHQLKLEPFWVQCNDLSGKVHFLEAVFVLSTKDSGIFHEISNNQKVLRDAIYYYLKIQDSSVLLDTTNQQFLKAGLLDAINEYVMNGPIDDVYIDSYLIK